MNPQITKPITIVAVILSFLLAFLPQDLEAQTRISRSDKGKSTIQVENNNRKLSIEYEGEITISNDETDIVDISRGGYIEIEKSGFGSKRRINIEADGSGKLIKEYYVGRKQQDWEPDGRQWLAEVLQEVLRSTMIGAEGRVDRMYAQGGASRVLSEIREMDSDYVTAGYLDLLLDKNLSNNEMIEAIEVTGTIDSDHYRAEILKGHQKKFLSNASATTAYINATNDMDSDHYKTEVLRGAIADAEITDAQMNSLLQSIGTVDSDHYMTEILTSIMDSRKLNGSNLDLIISTSRNIDSDHYKTEVLRRALNKDGLSTDNINTILQMVNDIDSDHYTSEVVKYLMDHKITGSNLDLLADIVTNNMDSDHYRNDVIRDLIKRQDLTDKNLDLIFTVIDQYDSDHYKTEVIGMISEKKSLTDDQLVKVINSCKSMDSDHYITEVLISMASRV
ncbi:MAG: hypothetical protein HKN68_11465, partial [Saprospiraceae bacterium]|nr:hypothetical protein [Saprospiraceae bacterium]